MQLKVASKDVFEFLILFSTEKLEVARVRTLIDKNLNVILRHLLNHLAQHSIGLIHAGTRVDFQNPDIPLFVNHEVEPEKLVGVLPSLELTLKRLYRRVDNALHFRPDFLLKKVPLHVQVFETGFELFLVDDQGLFVVIRRVLLNRVIRQMYINVSLFQTEVEPGLSEVALLVHIYGEGLHSLQQDPLSDVELLSPQQKRSFYVLLDDVLDVVVLHVVLDVFESVEHLDASSSRKAHWLHYPGVFHE